MAIKFPEYIAGVPTQNLRIAVEIEGTLHRIFAPRAPSQSRGQAAAAAGGFTRNYLGGPPAEEAGQQTTLSLPLEMTPGHRRRPISQATGQGERHRQARLPGAGSRNPKVRRWGGLSARGRRSDRRANECLASRHQARDRKWRFV